MKNKLIKLQKKSYSPYSNFKVAAILVTATGKEYEGVNIESATYTPSVCAERSALSAAISQGEKPGTFKEIHLIGGDGTRLVTPCGVCRQVLFEHMSEDGLLFHYVKDEVVKLTIKELLPHAFSDKNLKFK